MRTSGYDKAIDDERVRFRHRIREIERRESLTYISPERWEEELRQNHIAPFVERSVLLWERTSTIQRYTKSESAAILWGDFIFPLVDLAFKEQALCYAQCDGINHDQLIQQLVEEHKKLCEWALEELAGEPLPEREKVCSAPKYDERRLAKLLEDAAQLKEQMEIFSEKVLGAAQDSQQKPGPKNSPKLEQEAKASSPPDLQKATENGEEEAEKTAKVPSQIVRHEDTEARRKVMFEFLKELNLEDRCRPNIKKEAEKVLMNQTHRHTLYDRFDKNEIPLFRSSGYYEFDVWFELKEDPVQDVESARYLAKDMRRQWDRFWDN